MNNLTNMLYYIFKVINPGTLIGIYNLKDGIEKETLAKFGKNV